MTTLYSKDIVESILASASQKAGELIDLGVDPQLGVLNIGSNPDSLKYITIKSQRAKENGVILSLYQMEADSKFAEVAETLGFLAEDEDMHGVIVQLPLPTSFSEAELNQLIQLIPAHKDVDGLRGDWQNQVLLDSDLPSLYQFDKYFLPPTVKAVFSLLDYYNLDIKDKKVVIIGEGRLIGQPLYNAFQKLGSEVETVNEETDNIIGITKQADILVCGTGHKDLVTYQWVKEGATVIDCAADVHYDSVSQVAGALSPSVGGVGPLTVAWLLYHTVQAAQAKNGENV